MSSQTTRSSCTLRDAAHAHDAALVVALLAAGANPAALAPRRGGSRTRRLPRATATSSGLSSTRSTRSTPRRTRSRQRALPLRCSRRATLSRTSRGSSLLDPLVGCFPPSDTTTIAKRGNAFRFDTNVVEISSVQPLYQRATVLLLGSKRLAPLSLTRRQRVDVLHRPRRADGAAAPRDEAA